MGGYLVGGDLSGGVLVGGDLLGGDLSRGGSGVRGSAGFWLSPQGRSWIVRLTVIAVI